MKTKVPEATATAGSLVSIINVHTAVGRSSKVVSWKSCVPGRIEGRMREKEGERKLKLLFCEGKAQSLTLVDLQLHVMLATPKITYQ